MASAYQKRIALGTVQFGLDYGISNLSGRVSRDGVEEILNHALSLGIDTLDTAIAYGCSEQVLGEFLSLPEYPFAVVSKLPPKVGAEAVSGEITASLQRLGRDSLFAYLAHSAQDYRDEGLREELARAKEGGRLRLAGLSVYHPRDLEWFLERDIPFDIVQIPYNLLDQRFVSLFPELKKRGVVIHARSIFLQGLFFLAPEKLSHHFSPIKELLGEIRAFAKEMEISLPSLLLGFALACPEIDRVVIGVTRREELVANMDALAQADRVVGVVAALARFAVADEEIILPYNWK